MIVPDDFMEGPKEGHQRIYVRRYTEQKPTKIYTEVRENLLVVVRKGRKHLVYQDFETSVCEGEFAFFKKGNYIMNQILGEEIYESLLIFVPDELLYVLPKSRENAHVPEKAFYTGAVVTHMEKEVEGILELMKENEPYSQIVTLKVIELLLHIQMNDSTGEFQSLVCSCRQRDGFEEELQKAYPRCRTVSALAQQLHMSESTMKRTFRKKYGITPHVWMNEQKLEKSVNLLVSTEYSVTDISFLCGFDSLSTYMTLFQKKYGTSPGRYRKAERGFSTNK